MANIIATWNISIDTECPQRKESFDIPQYGEFCKNSPFKLAENGTERTKNVEVECPNCSHGFLVDLMW